MSELKPVILLQEASLGYTDKPFLKGLNFSIFPSEFVYLVGRTGSGKSTILKSLYADLRPLQGYLEVCKFDIGKIKKGQVPLLRRKMGIIFQDYQLLTDRNVSENLTFVMHATGWKDSAKIKARISELLIKVGLSSKASTMPHQLSGGEQQRLSIARSLVNNPAVIIADEATGNLDPEVSARIVELLLQINLGGTAIVMATHDYNLITEFPARTLECIDGQVIDHPIGGFKRKVSYS